MPNGHDKGFVRLLGALHGFRNRYGHWPIRVRIFPGALDNLRSLFTEEDFSKLTSRLKLIPDEAPFVAEDEEGNTYSYGAEGGGWKPKDDLSAAEWLGVEPSKRSGVNQF